MSYTSPEIKSTPPKAEISLHIAQSTGYAYGIAHHPDRQNLAQRAAQLAQRPRWLMPLFFVTNARLESTIVKQTTESIEQKAHEVVSEVRGANSECEIQDPISYIGIHGSGRVTFQCHAINCCRLGLIKAQQELNSDLSSTATEVRAELRTHAGLDT